MERRNVALAFAVGAAGLVVPRMRTQPGMAQLPQLRIRTARSSARRTAAPPAAAAWPIRRTASQGPR